MINATLANITKKGQIFKTIETAVLGSIKERLKHIENNLKLFQLYLDKANIDVVKVFSSGHAIVTDEFIRITIENNISMLEFTILHTLAEDLKPINKIDISLSSVNNGVSMILTTSAGKNNDNGEISADLLILIAEQFPEIQK